MFFYLTAGTLSVSRGGLCVRDKNARHPRAPLRRHPSDGLQTLQPHRRQPARRHHHVQQTPWRRRTQHFGAWSDDWTSAGLLQHRSWFIRGSRRRRNLHRSRRRRDVCRPRRRRRDVHGARRCHVHGSRRRRYIHRSRWRAVQSGSERALPGLRGNGQPRDNGLPSRSQALPGIVIFIFLYRKELSAYNQK
jgi:hypothetical protein